MLRSFAFLFCLTLLGGFPAYADDVQDALNSFGVGAGQTNSETVTLSSSGGGNSGSQGNGDSPTITNGTISGNTANEGGGIANAPDAVQQGLNQFGVGAGNPNSESVTFSSSGSGSNMGAIQTEGGTVSIDNSTIPGNTASQSGGGIFNDGGTLSIDNTSIQGNTTNDGGGIFNSNDAVQQGLNQFGVGAGNPNSERININSGGSNSAGAGGGGVFSADYNALSDLPEVTSGSPGRNRTAGTPGTSFVFTFSQPMDKSTVEENFIIRSFTEEELSIDDPGDQFPKFDHSGGSGSDVPSGGAAGNIWDRDAFDVNWNSDSTQVDLSFKNELDLPSSSPPMSFFVIFNDGEVRVRYTGGQAPGNRPLVPIVDTHSPRVFDGIIRDVNNPGIILVNVGPNTDGIGSPLPFGQTQPSGSNDVFGDSLGPDGTCHASGGLTCAGGDDVGTNIFNTPGGPGTFAPSDDVLLNDPVFFDQRFGELFGTSPIQDPNELPN